MGRGRSGCLCKPAVRRVRKEPHKGVSVNAHLVEGVGEEVLDECAVAPVHHRAFVALLAWRGNVNSDPRWFGQDSPVFFVSLVYLVRPRRQRRERSVGGRPQARGRRMMRSARAPPAARRSGEDRPGEEDRSGCCSRRPFFVVTNPHNFFLSVCSSYEHTLFVSVCRSCVSSSSVQRPPIPRRCPVRA